MFAKYGEVCVGDLMLLGRRRGELKDEINYGERGGWILYPPNDQFGFLFILLLVIINNNNIINYYYYFFVYEVA